MIPETKMIIGNQAIRIHSNDSRLRAITKDLHNHLTYYELVANPVTKKYHAEPSMYFFTDREKDNYFDFIISKNNKSDLLYFIRESNYTIPNLKIYKKPYDENHKVSIPLRKEFKPREEQRIYIDKIVKTEDVMDMLIDLQTGFGKANSLDTDIRIPNGWKKMRDIKVNDEIITQDGSTTKVTGVYPQGLKDMYKVTFYDGRNVECCLEHLWKVYEGKVTNIYSPYDTVGEVIDTGTILKNINSKHYFIDLPVSEKYEHNERLNVLNNILKDKAVTVNGNTKTFTTTNLELTNSITLLVRSLGGICKTNKIEKTNTTSYKSTIILPDPTINLKLKIDKIEYIGKKEAQCISVEHKSRLYIVNDYIVTHNTLIGYFSAVELRTRPAIIIKPAFLKKWVEDVKKYSPLENDEIFIIQGSDSLRKLFSFNKQERKRIKVYIISTRTINNYFDSYYTDDFNYSVSPFDFMDFTGILTVLNDESHKEFETTFKTIMWMDPLRIVGMSATMDSDKRNMNYFYNLLYPVKNRCISLFGIRKYVHLLFYHFSLSSGIFLQHKGMMGYNHIKYEQSIMRDTKLLKDYIELILDIADKYYYVRKDNKDKLLVVFSTIDMCTIMSNAFKKKYQDLVIKRYVKDDSYLDMLTGDIIVSTNGSTGTAIDIPGLITSIQTVPISDKQLNIQAMGRLREIPGKEVIYISLHNDSIKSHAIYKDKRYSILKNRIKFVSSDRYTKTLGDAGAVYGTNKTYKNFSKTFKQRKFKSYNGYGSKK